MDPYSRHMNNRLEKCKAFEPKLKMSTGKKPMSEFGVFQAVDESKKKSKKEQRATSAQHDLKGKADVSLGDGKDKSKSKNEASTSRQKPAPQKNKSSDAESKNKILKESEIIATLLQLLGDSPKKLTLAEQKNKEDFQNYLLKQLETVNGTSSDDEEYSYSYESSSDWSTRTIYSRTDKDNGDQATINQSNRKRKSPETSNSKGAKSSAVPTNVIPESKKSEKPEEQKNTSGKSLPATKANKGSPDETKRGKGNDKTLNRGAKKTSGTTDYIKLEPLYISHNIRKFSSIYEGKRAFKWLLNPVTVGDFFGKYWEYKACLIKRTQANYFSKLISFEAIDQMLLINHLEFTKNLDVTSYRNGIRETLNPEGRAMPSVVWDHYVQGCSVRLINPQMFLPHLYSLNTTLQEYFHCLVGANAYLTPPNSQGFAPHYDDIEAFVLQIEGRKRWKLYKPRSTSEILPRDSSRNYTQKEIGKPILEEVLEPGDVLYFPRGTIHQACTEPGFHSLHITLTVYQRQSYADLFEQILPLMLQKAISTNVEMRRGLPLHTWQHAGFAHSDNSTKQRVDLQRKVTQLLYKCVKDISIKDILDTAVDQVAKKFQHEALPPEILPSEKLRTIFGSRSCTNERGECICDYDINERTNVCLLRANILRLVKEEEKFRIYYYVDNSKEYCQYGPNSFEIGAMEAAGVEVLIKSYPAYVRVSQLPLPSDVLKIYLVGALWERGLLMMEKPFR